ncbi:unnamed protein product [Alopecurus aequalis]
MGSAAGTATVLLCLALSMVAAASAVPEKKPHFITKPSSSRKLIGVFATGFCPVHFDETRKMGRIESKCRGQEMPNAECCKAFKAVACPYADLLDELTNHCNDELLLKIHAFCSVPIGYFSFCGDSVRGISCPQPS